MDIAHSGTQWLGAALAATLLLSTLPLAAEAEESAFGTPELRGMDSLPPTSPPLPSIGSVRPIRLRDAVALTLRKNPNIRLQQETVAYSAGQLQQAAGAFDYTLSGEGYITYSYLSEDTSSSDTIVAGLIEEKLSSKGMSRLTERDVSGQVSLSKQLRNGITVTPQGTISNDLDRQTGEVDDDGSAFLGFTLTVPVLQGLGPHNADASAERAAKINLEASRYTLEYTVANELYTTINAYWDCLLAQANVRVARKNETDAHRLVTITRALIKGFVQPAIQLTQAKANLETYASTRITAEQEQSSATQALAVAIGLGPEELLHELLVVDPFPKPPPEPLIQPDRIPQLVSLALRRRADLAAARRMVAANAALAAGAENSALPQLNVQFGGGFQYGTTSTSITDSSTRARGPGYAVGGGISLDWPLLNDAAKGALTQQRAQLAQARTSLLQLESQVASDVVTAAKSVLNNRNAFVKAKAAAIDQRTTVQAQEKLFSMGMTSLVEVITTQTNLASAELTVVETLANYTQAIANLRFVTGTLIPSRTDDLYTFNVNDLLRLPSVEEERPVSE
jgi:outer membrane protein